MKEENNMNKNYVNNNQQNLNNNHNINFSSNSGTNNYGDISNTNNNQNYHVVMMTVRFCKILSIWYIVVWFFLILFMIFAAICYSYFSHNRYSNLDIGFIICMIFVSLLSVFLLALGIYLISETNKLKKYYNDIGFLTSLFWIGLIFFGFTSVIASFVTISVCKQTWSQKLDELKQNLDTKLTGKPKKMYRKDKKSVSIGFLVFDSVIVVASAGLVGGTYGSYSNYQLLSSMENTINNNNQLLSLGYKLNVNNELYFDKLVNNRYGYDGYSFGSYYPYNYGTYEGNYTVKGLSDFFGLSFSNWNEWLSGTGDTNDSYGIINYLSSLSQPSSTNDANSLNQAIQNLNNFKSDISSGFPNSSDILNVLDYIGNSNSYYNTSYNYNLKYIQKDDSIAQRLTNDLNPYNGASGLLSIISTIDSDFTQLINDKVINLNGMNSTTKQYFENYISLLGTNSATLIEVNPSPFVAMFDTNQAINAFGNSSAIGLNSLSLYLQTASSQTYFGTTFALYQFAINSLNSAYAGFSMDQISPDGWNKKIVNLSDFQKANLNNILQSQKNTFYQTYSTWDGTWKNVANRANLSDDEAYDIYYLQDSIYHLNCNYNADQSGVIAGSVLLAIGIIILIISVVFLVKIKKFKKEEKIEIQ